MTVEQAEPAPDPRTAPARGWPARVPRPTVMAWNDRYRIWAAAEAWARPGHADKGKESLYLSSSR